MNFKKLILPVSVSMLLSAFNILHNNVGRLNMGSEILKIAHSWAVTSLYLLIIWLANNFLYARQYFVQGINKAVIKAVSALAFNALLIYAIVFVSSTILGDTTNLQGQYVPQWVAFIKLCVATALIVCIQYAITSLQQTQAYKLANAQLQNENLEARLQSLKQQINPHFLFNALSTLRTMVRANDANAEKFIMNLSEVYRQLLKSRDLATITLGEEIEFLKSYVFMLHARFENTLAVEINILPESTQRQIPAFSLQLLVENCIKHNIVSSAKPLHVNIYQVDTTSVTVENNLQLKPSYTDDTSGFGLDNLKKRYGLLAIEAGVKVFTTDNKFTVTLQLL